jgi:hypothetical protein
LASVTGATLLFCHHTNKLARQNGGDAAGTGRGSSSLFDGARWEASLGLERVLLDDPEARERLGELVTLTFTKSNYSRRADPLCLRREAGGPLVPIDDADRETIAEAKDLTGRREAEREAKRRERDAADDDAVRAIIARTPGLGTRELRAAVKVARACGSERADAAVRRIRPGGEP